MSILEANIQFINQQLADGSEHLSLSKSVQEWQESVERLGYSISDIFLFNLSVSHLPWNDIKILLLDVDGVLTEGGMFYDENGGEYKRFDTKDGMAIKETLKRNLLEIGIISSGINEGLVKHRANVLGIHRVYVGLTPKLEIAEAWMRELNLKWQNVAYIGDDINDIQLFERAAIAACPSNAAPRMKAMASFVLQTAGGQGCVREFLRYIPALTPIL